MCWLPSWSNSYSRIEREQVVQFNKINLARDVIPRKGEDSSFARRFSQEKTGGNSVFCAELSFRLAEEFFDRHLIFANLIAVR